MGLIQPVRVPGSLRTEKNQRNRRNMTEKDLLRLIDIVDKRQEQKEVIASQSRDEGGRFLPCASIEADGKSKKTAEKTAAIVGTSRTKVERARRVLSDPKEKAAVLAGKKSIYKAAQDVGKAKRQNQVYRTAHLTLDVPQKSPLK
jgi:hypothetical protein